MQLSSKNINFSFFSMSFAANYEKFTINFNVISTTTQDPGSFPIMLDEGGNIIKKGILVVPPVDLPGKRYVRGFTIHTTIDFNNVDIVATLQKVPAGQFANNNLYPTANTQWAIPITSQPGNVLKSWIYPSNVMRFNEGTITQSPSADEQVIEFNKIVTLERNEYIVILFSNWYPLVSSDPSQGFYYRYTSIGGTVSYYITQAH